MNDKTSTPFEQHLFVCHGSRCEEVCAKDESGESLLKKQLKERMQALGLKGRVRVSQSGCLGVCESAPNVMNYPSGDWYARVELEDLKSIEVDVLQRSPQDR